MGTRHFYWIITGLSFAVYRSVLYIPYSAVTRINWCSCAKKHSKNCLGRDDIDTIYINVIGPVMIIFIVLEVQQRTPKPKTIFEIIIPVL